MARRTWRPEVMFCTIIGMGAVMLVLYMTMTTQSTAGEQLKLEDLTQSSEQRRQAGVDAVDEQLRQHEERDTHKHEEHAHETEDDRSDVVVVEEEEKKDGVRLLIRGKVREGDNVAAPPRVCGSPAVDGYAHVNLTCLRESPTMKQWEALGSSNMGFGVWMERHASYDGIGVKWGPHNKQPSAEACARDCLEWEPKGDEFPCNAWVYCPQDVCFEPDAHEHKKGDCWLKFTETPSSPEVNQRGAMNPAFRERHKGFKGLCDWISGTVLPAGLTQDQGVFGPRAEW